MCIYKIIKCSVYEELVFQIRFFEYGKILTGYRCLCDAGVMRCSNIPLVRCLVWSTDEAAAPRATLVRDEAAEPRATLVRDEAAEPRATLVRDEAAAPRATLVRDEAAEPRATLVRD